MHKYLSADNFAKLPHFHFICGHVHLETKDFKNFFKEKYKISIMYNFEIFTSSISTYNYIHTHTHTFVYVGGGYADI